VLTDGITRTVARQIYGGMLWLMRRPFIRRMQRGSLNLIPASRREKARQSYLRQERFARRIGLPLVTFVVGLAFLSILATAMTMLILEGINQGWFLVPTRSSGL